MPRSTTQVLLGAASDSSGTSPAIFVGDCRLLSVSVQTSTGSASNVTIQLSNADGLQSSTFFWSTVTVLPLAGIFTVDPGARWIRAERANIGISATSNTTVLLNRYYE
jgi:hypothetical protein